MNLSEEERELEFWEKYIFSICVLKEIPPKEEWVGEVGRILDLFERERDYFEIALRIRNLKRQLGEKSESKK